MTISEWPNQPSSQVIHLTEQLGAAENYIETLEESFADLGLAAEDAGWQRLGHQADLELTRTGLAAIARNCRVMAVASPMVKRGLQLRIGYVWGQGVQVQARAGADEEQDVDAVVQAFWDDESNQAAFTSSQAQEENERVLGTDGNFFLAFFTNPLTGRVQLRSTPFDEIQDVIKNPEDRDEDWFYARQWTVTVVEAGYGGGTRSRTETRRALHPALGYRPRLRPKRINGIPVSWDAPMLHVPVNRLDGQKFGIPDAYAALPWARAYEGFLTDWARLVKALSKFAWRLTGDRSSKARAAAQKLKDAQTAMPVRAGGPGEVGAVAAGGPGVHLEAIPKSGATIDSESGKPLASMVAAALGVSVVDLLADPGITGARAVAETLDKPVILEMTMRRNLWTSVIHTVTSYVVDQAVRAPRGPLSGTVRIDPGTGREVITLAGDVERTVEVTWPDLNDLDPVKLVEAIVAADSTMALRKQEIARLLLHALNVKDVDEVLAEMEDEDGNFVDPSVTAGQQAADRFRRGEDPVDALA